MLRQQTFALHKFNYKKSGDLAIFNGRFMYIRSAQFAKLRYFEIALHKLEIANQFRYCTAKFIQFRNCVAQIRNSKIVQGNFES